ncbi:hypothetical protein [Candidatus Thiosymbion oneisti]|uniref:hypothetical protein n=1 Tax=Candidatus Thiosymbion oneisti TaxID=589554 RepID=UPI000B7DFAD9|nr:hypothetical protein [Candidatus Thiosymbion oneisti]
MVDQDAEEKTTKRANRREFIREDSHDSSFLLFFIANHNAAGMPLRMLRYYTDIRFAGHAGHIRQFLIYIGSDRLNMQAGIDEPGLLDYRYGLVDMHRVNCAGLLVQDNPDALVLAVLCDFGDRRPQEVVTYIDIVRRLQELLGTDERRFRDYMTVRQGMADPHGRGAQRMGAYPPGSLVASHQSPASSASDQT